MNNKQCLYSAIPKEHDHIALQNEIITKNLHKNCENTQSKSHFTQYPTAQLAPITDE